VNFVCVLDITNGLDERYGVFRIEEEDHPPRWEIARFPRSWPRGEYAGIERPTSVLAPFHSEADAVRTLDRMTRLVPAHL
jgi:hypothetical protein